MPIKPDDIPAFYHHLLNTSVYFLKILRPGIAITRQGPLSALPKLMPQRRNGTNGVCKSGFSSALAKEVPWRKICTRASAVSILTNSHWKCRYLMHTDFLRKPLHMFVIMLACPNVLQELSIGLVLNLVGPTSSPKGPNPRSIC